MAWPQKVVHLLDLFVIGLGGGNLVAFSATVVWHVFDSGKASSWIGPCSYIANRFYLIGIGFRIMLERLVLKSTWIQFRHVKQICGVLILGRAGKEACWKGGS